MHNKQKKNSSVFTTTNSQPFNNFSHRLYEHPYTPSHTHPLQQMTTVLVWLLVVHLVNNNRFRKLYILSFFVYEFLFSAHFDHPYSHHLYTSLCHSLFLTKTSSLIIHTFAFPSFIRTPQPSPYCFPPPTNPPFPLKNTPLNYTDWINVVNFFSSNKERGL